MTITTEEFDKKSRKVLSRWNNSKRNICLNSCYGHVEWMFVSPVQNFYTIRPKAQYPKLVEKNEFFLRKSLYPEQIIPIKTLNAFKNLEEKNLEKGSKKVADCPKKVKIFFSRNLFSFFVPMATRKANWKHCRKCFHRKLKRFCSMSKIDEQKVECFPKN